MQAAGAMVEEVLPSWACVQGVRHGFHPDDPLFAAGDADRLRGYQTVGEHLRRAPVASLLLPTSLETEMGHGGLDEDDVLECTVPGCLQRFATATSYDTHFRSAHLNVCAECRKVLPTEKLLMIHVAECHDLMFPLLAAKQPMYECLVPGCDVMSSNCETRKTHLVDFHLYPSSFRVGKFIGVRRERSKHKPSGKHLSLDKHGAGSKEDGAMAIDAKDEMDHASPAAGEAEGAGMEVEEDKPATVVRGVPSGICFGRRGRGRGFVPYGGRGRGTSCYRCGKLGHIKRDCPQRPTGASSAGKDSS